MGNGMTCATTEICGGAVVAQVAQKAGLRHCATTHPPKGGYGWGGASGASALRWRGGGAMMILGANLKKVSALEVILIGRNITEARKIARDALGEP